MLYGQSDYVFEDGATGGMGWAARLHFARFPDGNILIDEYHIFPVSIRNVYVSKMILRLTINKSAPPRAT